MIVLVLESSTASAKAMVYCSERGVLDIKTEAYFPEYSDVETHDAEGVFQQTIRLGKNISKGYNIDAISLCGTWHSVLLCDKQMKPKTKTFSWAHTKSAKIAAKLRRDTQFVKKYYQSTGCMVNATYPAFKLLFLKEQGMDFKNTYVLGQGSYNFFRLTDERVVTRSMASGSGLLNIHTKEFDKDVLDLIGIKEEQLGRLVDYDEVFPLTEEGAKLLDLKAGIPVLPTNPDGALNQVGAGALKNGIMTFSVGTSAAIRLSTDKPIIPENPSTWCYLSPVSWLSGAATAGGCNCIDWIKGKYFDKTVTYSHIESKKYNISDMPVFLPFIYGERCPGWRDDRRAGFFDINANHDVFDMYYSVMEGIIFNIYHCYEILTEINGEPEKIKLSGGILNSKFWTQLCCNIFGKEMEVSKLEQTSVLGGAALALKVLGKVDDLKNISFDNGEIVKPNYEMKKIYAEKFERYKYWYNKTM